MKQTGGMDLKVLYLGERILPKDDLSVQILDKRLPIAWFLGIPLSYFIVS
jgi:hypothetical protein